MTNNSQIVDAPIHQPGSDYHFSEGAYFPPQFKIVGVFFIIAGIILCGQLNIFGMLLLVPGLIFVLARKELTISFSLLRYRHSFAIFKYRFGSWQTLPDFESISIFSVKKSQDMSVVSQSATFGYSEIEVNLVYNTSRRLTVFMTKDFHKALETARLFASKFKLRIFDATKREGSWID